MRSGARKVIRSVNEGSTRWPSTGTVRRHQRQCSGPGSMRSTIGVSSASASGSVRTFHTVSRVCATVPSDLWVASNHVMDAVSPAGVPVKRRD